MLFRTPTCNSKFLKLERICLLRLSGTHLQLHWGWTSAVVLVLALPFYVLYTSLIQHMFSSLCFVALGVFCFWYLFFEQGNLKPRSFFKARRRFALLSKNQLSSFRRFQNVLKISLFPLQKQHSRCYATYSIARNVHLWLWYQRRKLPGESREHDWVTLGPLGNDYPILSLKQLPHSSNGTCSSMCFAWAIFSSSVIVLKKGSCHVMGHIYTQSKLKLWFLKRKLQFFKFCGSLSVLVDSSVWIGRSFEKAGTTVGAICGEQERTNSQIKMLCKKKERKDPNVWKIFERQATTDSCHMPKFCFLNLNQDVSTIVL